MNSVVIDISKGRSTVAVQWQSAPYHIPPHCRPCCSHATGVLLSPWRFFEQNGKSVQMKWQVFADDRRIGMCYNSSVNFWVFG